jgi:NAD(P)-dependent dehydrogenase (short-subunit alcohol dehydrogenase family)
MMRYEGKTALITGGTMGIGLGAALRLASEGANIVITGRRPEPGADAIAQIEAVGGQARFVQGDVAKTEDAERMVAETLEAFGRLDVAVNNAGITGQMTPVHRMDEDYFDSVINVNLKGVWQSMRFEIPPMLEQGGGSIINISSVAGVKGGPVAGSAYIAAKHGVVGLTRSAASEYARKQIRVNCLAPAVIETPLAAESFADPELRAKVEAAHPIGRTGQPEDVAGAIAYLGSDEAAFITGTVFPIDGGFLL